MFDERTRGASEYGANYERNKWIYENRAKMTLRQLETELEGLAAANGWTPIGGEAIRDAVKHYAEYFSLPRPRVPRGRRPVQECDPETMP